MKVKLRIRQETVGEGQYQIRLTLVRENQADLEGEAKIDFTLTETEREELRWYLEDYLTKADTVEAVVPEQVEDLMQNRGEELYTKVLAANLDTQAIWFAIREQLADLRVEITTPVAEAASIPWELMRDPQSDSAIALRVESFVRVQSNPSLSFVPVPELKEDGRVRLLYVVCRPSGVADVELRAVANRILNGLGENRARFDITALRPPTYEQLQTTLRDAKAAGRPYHIVHFDGHGVYADLSKSILADWLAALSSLTLGGTPTGKHGYLLFELPGADEKMRPVHGAELGQLLHDTGVPCLVLNACQSAMHEATEAPKDSANPHDEVRAIGSLAQSIIDQGIPAVLGMRYSVYVVTAAQYIGELYASLAKGRGFGQAASEGRKHLAANPERWLGLEPRPLRDWFVPVVYEAAPLQLLSPGAAPVADAPELDPVQLGQIHPKYVPDSGFIGRDETLLLLDRGFDEHPVVLLHAYAGQGKTTTAVEFARWYAQTGGFGPQPIVLFTSFETTTTLADVLNQLGQQAVEDWHAINEPEKRRQLVQQLLRQIPVLWIWDNVEPIAGFPEGADSAWTAEEQSELADFLKLIKLDNATRAKILLTSRRDESKWLGANPGIPHRVKMPRMRDGDAASLALKLGAERKLTRAEIAGWQPLLDYCDGNPLTLRVLVGQAVKMGLRADVATTGSRRNPDQPGLQSTQIEMFVQAIRDGEQGIEDVDKAQGRDKSLGASLDYGFRNAFSAEELPVIALLHLFQGVVDVDALKWMGNEEVDHSLPELRGRSKEELTKQLERAAETGLLTHLGATWFSIHPALPWFLRQLFAEFYVAEDAKSSDSPGNEGSETSEFFANSATKTTATQAQRAWVEAMGALSDHYHNQFNNGNREVIQFLELEESNLLHARRLALRREWWPRVTSAMQGLRQLYGYQGRGAEWARLVTEIIPRFCGGPDQDEPIPGRESRYSLVMEYRVDLAKDQDRNLELAAKLQEKCVAWDRKEAAEALALPQDAPLDAHQRHRIRTLGVSVFTLGQILMEGGNPDCVAAYKESLRHDQRIGDTAAEAIDHYNLGHAYMDLPAIRDLDAAQDAYQRSLDLFAENDSRNRALAIKQIGMVHWERSKDTRAEAAKLASAGEAEDAPSGAETEKKLEALNQQLLAHAQAAESRYQEALKLCPPTALADLGPIHNQLGTLYAVVGQTERAREHFEKTAQLFEQSGNRYNAGQVRFNLALMYLQSAEASAGGGAGNHNLLRRAKAYAEAALRDFQHFQGRAAEDEARARGLIEHIEKRLANTS